MAKSELQVFDGLDNRKTLMELLGRLGSDQRRAEFLKSLMPSPARGLSGVPAMITGDCDTVAAYCMMLGICNELGVSINTAARKLEGAVRHC